MSYIELLVRLLRYRVGGIFAPKAPMLTLKAVRVCYILFFPSLPLGIYAVTILFLGLFRLLALRALFFLSLLPGLLY